MFILSLIYFILRKIKKITNFFKMKNKNFNKALIIGPSGIGTVHLENF